MSIIVEQLEQKLQERKEAWWGWHKKNPQVWNKFEEYTLEAIATGRKHYSHWAIINRIRWNREIETNGGSLRLAMITSASMLVCFMLVILITMTSLD
jgi:hypothetical protein